MPHAAQHRALTQRIAQPMSRTYSRSSGWLAAVLPSARVRAAQIDDSGRVAEALDRTRPDRLCAVRTLHVACAFCVCLLACLLVCLLASLLRFRFVACA
jgi:hypothetical protein